MNWPRSARSLAPASARLATSRSAVQRALGHVQTGRRAVLFVLDGGPGRLVVAHGAVPGWDGPLHAAPEGRRAIPGSSPIARFRSLRFHNNPVLPCCRVPAGNLLRSVSRGHGLDGVLHLSCSKYGVPAPATCAWIGLLACPIQRCVAPPAPSSPPGIASARGPSRSWLPSWWAPAGGWARRVATLRRAPHPPRGARPGDGRSALRAPLDPGAWLARFPASQGWGDRTCTRALLDLAHCNRQKGVALFPPSNHWPCEPGITGESLQRGYRVAGVLATSSIKLGGRRLALTGPCEIAKRFARGCAIPPLRAKRLRYLAGTARHLQAGQHDR